MTPLTAAGAELVGIGPVAIYKLPDVSEAGQVVLVGAMVQGLAKVYCDSVPTEVTMLEQWVVVDGSPPVLLDVKSTTAAATLEASVLRALLRWLLCNAGTARKTTSRISAAMASTIMTSMMVKPCRPTGKFSLLVVVLGAILSDIGAIYLLMPALVVGCIGISKVRLNLFIAG